MERNRRIGVLAAGFGLGVWVLDAAIDALFFSDATFLALLVTDVPAHELYMRSVILAGFLVFGVVVAGLSGRLQERERDVTLFQTLLDEATDGIFVIDPETGQFLDANDTACEMLGYDRATVLDMDVADVNVTFDDAESFRTFIRGGEGARLQTYETEHARADGTTFPVEVSASDVTIDDRQYRIAIARDVTERKERERAIRTSREHYESLFSSIRDAILVVDTDRRIVDCNPAFTALFGYSLAEVEGEPTQVIYASDADFEGMAQALRGRDARLARTVTYEKQSGQTFPGETNVSALRDADGEITGYIGLIRDVSERQERLRQIKVIDRVLRHNLHNDMNVIMGLADQIRGSTSGEPASTADRILDTCDGLLETTDKEREVTKFLADSSRRTSLDPTTFLPPIVTDLRDRYPDADVSVVHSGDGVVRAVPQIERAVAELLENAVVHSDRTHPSVEAHVVAEEDSVEIRVEDDGPGIPEMERRILTDRAEIGPLYHGRGLGLWFVNLVVEHSGGTLTFEANEPRGTVVTMRFSPP